MLRKIYTPRLTAIMIFNKKSRIIIRDYNTYHTRYNVTNVDENSHNIVKINVNIILSFMKTHHPTS